MPSAPLLFVPNVTHLSDAAFAGLKRYKGRLVLVGDDPLLTRNEYDEVRRSAIHGASETPDKSGDYKLSFNYPHTTWRDLWQSLLPKLFAWNVRPSVQVLDEKGQPLAGVEWLCASTPKGIVVNLCNYRNEPLRVTLWRNGKKVGGVDLLSGEKIKDSATLAPLQVRLVRVD